MSQSSMSKNRALFISVLLVTNLFVPAATNAAPKVFVLDAARLENAKRRIAAHDKEVQPALDKLVADANKALSVDTYSVVSKKITPPSGDKHDYMSQAPYFWPDPGKPNGVPYIRRDGERNPEIEKISDHDAMDRMRTVVETLALAYYFSADERYATKATQLLRVFFLNPDTRMNPNLDYAQGIPGINTGRGIGLIETRGLTSVVDSVGLLSGSKSWTNNDQRGMEDWFGKFLQWMLESKNGKDESASKNNHGTYYDVQVASFALFTGKRELAKQVLVAARTKRIALQVEPDGRQPLELARTKGWSYSIMNLEGLMQLARLSDNVGVDLWNYTTPDGRSIRKALEFLTPYAFNEKWPYQQLGTWPQQQLYPLIRRAANRFNDPALQQAVTKMPARNVSDRAELLN
ncbi:MAG TPA: alginate lyase family protein [Pyrinomonadaceae bacterium]